MPGLWPGSAFKIKPSFLLKKPATLPYIHRSLAALFPTESAPGILYAVRQDGLITTGVRLYCDKTVPVFLLSIIQIHHSGHASNKKINNCCQTSPLPLPFPVISPGLLFLQKTVFILEEIIFPVSALLHPCFIILQVISDMYSCLFTWKTGKYIDGTVLPQQPCPPDTLFQFTFYGIQLHFPQQRIFISSDQKAVSFILSPAKWRSLIEVLY